MALPRFQHFIDGAFCDADQYFLSLDPSTGEAWAEMPAASEADVDRAVTAADRAFHDPAWAGLFDYWNSNAHRQFTHGRRKIDMFVFHDEAKGASTDAASKTMEGLPLRADMK